MCTGPFGIKGCSTNSSSFAVLSTIVTHVPIANYIIQYWHRQSVLWPHLGLIGYARVWVAFWNRGTGSHYGVYYKKKKIVDCLKAIFLPLNYRTFDECQTLPLPFPGRHAGTLTTSLTIRTTRSCYLVSLRSTITAKYTLLMDKNNTKI